ncbi:MAG TPA: hypothetical protein VK483_00790 [Chitinophagaceae bacterium]|nr:hypothetical protein [Chitinophagaceae bacterium]
MKKLLVILGLSFFTSTACFSQGGDNDNDKIREKMSEFIQRRMGLSRAEAERFNPVFMRYFREWKTTIQTNRNDRPMLQLRIAELRIRYRSEFKDIVGEKRCNQIYDHQEVFIQEIQKLRREELGRRPIRRTKFMVN